MSEPLVYTAARRRCPLRCQGGKTATASSQLAPWGGPMATELDCSNPDCSDGYVSVPVTEPCGEGDWSKATDEWRVAATRWRDDFHTHIDARVETP